MIEKAASLKHSNRRVSGGLCVRSSVAACDVFPSVNIDRTLISTVDFRYDVSIAERRPRRAPFLLRNSVK